IVDDVPANLRLATRVLSKDGHRVTTAGSGHEALAAVARNHPDLILLDVVIPGPNGFEVCRQLKSDPATRLIPIILITAMQETADRIRGIEAGADDFISKPFNSPELRARVRSLIRLKRYTDDLDS